MDLIISNIQKVCADSFLGINYPRLLSCLSLIFLLYLLPTLVPLYPYSFKTGRRELHEQEVGIKCWFLG